MAQVFVSHASVDKEYASEFVESILVRGCGLKPSTEIFYSSGDDTGIASGLDVMREVRRRVSSTTLVVALITPIFQTRPVCVAELGAAWGRDGALFPLLAPSMKRTELEGIIPGILTKAADDKSALNELCQRLRDLGVDINQQSWGVGQERWLAFLRRHPDALSRPATLSSSEGEALRSDLRDARAALDVEQATTEELRRQIERLVKAKTSAEVRAAVLPEEDSECLEALLTSASKSLRKIPAIVREAIWFELAEGSMPWPSAYDGDDQLHQVVDAQRDGLLIDHGDDLVPNAEFPTVNEASTEIRRLHKFLQEAGSEEFTSWFASQYEVPQDLTKRATWRALDLP